MIRVFTPWILIFDYFTKKRSEKFGGKSREAAETLYLYGKALLGNAIQKNQVIGGGNVAGVASAAEQGNPWLMG